MTLTATLIEIQQVNLAPDVGDLLDDTATATITGLGTVSVAFT